MKKKLVMMLETQHGSEDGTTVEIFEKENVYPIEESLADVFIENEWAIAVKEADLKEDDGGGKDKGGSNENKDQGGANENKGAGGFEEIKDFEKAGQGKFIKLWTRQEMEKMKMDEVCEIGNPPGAKDTNKNELIKEILKAQEKLSKPEGGGILANIKNMVAGGDK